MLMEQGNGANFGQEYETSKYLLSAHRPAFTLSLKLEKLDQ
jgi:hypothetical protein